MPKAYRIGDTEYRFPDNYTDSQVQSILTKQGVIKGRTAGSGKTGTRLKGNPKGLEESFMGTLTSDLASAPGAVASAGPQAVYSMRHPVQAASQLSQIPRGVIEDFKSGKYGKIGARALELILPGLSTEKGEQLAGAAARGVESAYGATADAVSSATKATGRVAKAVAPELPGTGIVSRVRERLNPTAVAAKSKPLSLAEMKAAVKRGAMSMEDYTKSLVDQGYKEHHAATMADNLKAEMDAAAASKTSVAKPPKSEKAPFSKLSDAPKASSKPISVDELKSAVKRKALTIEQYEQELIKHGYPSADAKLMAENLKTGIESRKPSTSQQQSSAGESTATKRVEIQHLRDRGGMLPAEHAKQLAKFLKDRGVSPSDMAHEGDWKLAAAAAGLPEPSAEVIEAARGQLGLRPSPRGTLKGPK